MQYKSIDFIPKIKPDSSEVLSLIYTPGVGYACKKIEKNDGLSYLYTNRENSVAVLSFDYSQSLKRAIFLKSTLNIDAYPFEVSYLPTTHSLQYSTQPSPLGGEGIFPHEERVLEKLGEGSKEIIKLIVENIYPNFCGIDLTLISDFVENIEFNVEIPVLKSLLKHPHPQLLSPQVGGEQCASQKSIDIKDFFKPFSKNIFQFSLDKLQGSFEEQSLSLREKAGGVIETELSENAEIHKPIAIISDGSAVLGFGNIGAEAGIPVMEGKAVLFNALGCVNAFSLCLKTQKSEEIIEIVKALKNSFGGVNLEDISAPRCFDIEKNLVEALDIPVFHDDQHGTAIVVLAALLNAISVADKKLDEIKIVISGAGAAAQAVSKLILTAGAKNITHIDKKGIVYKGRIENDDYLEKLADITNKSNLKGGLEDAIEGADVFIGLSAAGVLKPEFVKKMSERAIVFALANPTPEIMPDEAKEAGAFIVATGRSDFDNQINNSIAFPGLFRGLLDNGIKKVTEEIKLECAIAIASIIKEDELSTTNILPNALDGRVVLAIANRLEAFS